MSTPRPIPHDVLAVQREASDPAVSAWVSANAGSGKTHVLAQRVIRLLLEGTDPGKILCLTFTKAAAANMANRVFTTLAKWTTLDDADLDKEIRNVGARTDGERRAAARRLFACALETPGGLKIQTIHGFCARLLQQFPFEAHVAARFRVLEETQQRQLMERLRLSVLLEAAAKPDSALGRALADATTAASDFAFKDALDEAITKRDEVTMFVEGAGGIDGVRAQLSQSLGLGAGQTIEQIEREIVEGPLLPLAEWGAVADVCAKGSPNDRNQSDRLHQAARSAGAERVEDYLSIFMTDKGTPRSSIITMALARKYPELAKRLEQERDRILTLHARRRGAAVRDRTAALLTIAVEIIARYRAEKDRSGLLDYDDLIDKTRALLDRGAAAWVHYKLDLGIDHLLIDEAQDTSAEQWGIVNKLVSEFTAGIGARGALERSIFAVGDEKQSIFSFQGAALEAFAEVGRQFRRAHQDASLPFLRLEFKHSFRSLQVVLDAVDKVFAQPAAFAGLSTDRAPTAHTAVREHAAGFVELWDLIEPDDKPEVEAWDAPFDTTSETNPRAKLARMIASSIRTWMARGDTVGSGADRHTVRPGDILILVRQRGPLFEAIIRALKDAAIPVAGADRLILTEHIAVMDLLVLADAILLEQDDLALATVLKSPLFGLSEDELFTLAWNRPGSLRARLREQRPDIARTLDRLGADARSATPFDFYTGLLGADGGRRHFVARLGTEANDALDEFLNLALDYESRETPSLQGFIAWMRTASADIKRDMEIARDEVRVMTVHGAKGLEAPIIILADTTTAPTGPPQYQPRLLALRGRGAPVCFAWMPNRNDEIEPIARARADAATAVENEYRRLLYVAMTRAADRLVVCGALGKQAMPPGCWYQLVQEGLAASGLLVEEAADHGDGTVLRFRTAPRQPAAPAPSVPTQMALTLEPAWLNTSVPTEPTIDAVLAPSGASPSPRVPGSRDETSGAARSAALLRGIVVHRLLQSLPDVPSERRAEVALQFLKRAGRDLIPEHDILVAQVIRLLDDARFQPLFAAGSRAEVPIVGRLVVSGRPRIVSGQIDRLAVTPDAVLIADYKTDRPAPRRPDEVPRGYLRQLALYRALLSRIYPGRLVRAALIWTDVPELMELSEETLEREIASLTCPEGGLGNA
jgi:ATP-dependent helicase/nuclease subunit A